MKKDQVIEMVKVTKPAASLELRLRVVEAVKKVVEVMFSICCSNNVDF